jgi:glycosyltransferase involved in cell wall biosynthesis
MRPRIAAVVCTYNRRPLLRLCVDGLLGQLLPPGEFEIIVVDNNSSDDTPQFLKEYSSAHPSLRAVREERQGLSAARNSGLAATDAPFVAFVDDDAIPEPDWLPRILQRFETLDPDVAMVGGDIDPIWGETPPEWLTPNMRRALSAELNWSDHARFVDGRDEWLFEGASGYRVEPLRELGFFPGQLGRVGDLLLSGEVAVLFRLRDRGFRFFYDPEIRVQHHIAADRLTKEWFRRRYFWQGVTGFRVNEYLKQNGINAESSMRIDLPVSEGAWLEAFDDTSDAPFDRALSTLYNLGYLLAAQGVVGT